MNLTSSFRVEGFMDDSVLVLMELAADFSSTWEDIEFLIFVIFAIFLGDWSIHVTRRFLETWPLVFAFVLVWEVRLAFVVVTPS